MRQLSMFVGLAMFLVAAPAHAFTVTVDGSLAEWTLAPPTTGNTAHIGRDAMGRGAWIWTDAAGDERTDFAMPDGRVDMTLVAITSDASNVYFAIRMSNIDVTSGDGAPQVQIAIDMDRVSGSGQAALAGFADTSVAADAEWEYLVQTRFGSGGTVPFVRDETFADVASGATQAITGGAAGTIEISVPWANLAIGAMGPPRPLRFTIASFRGNTSDDTFDTGGAGVSNAVDVVSFYADPRPSAFPNTFTEVSDGVIDHRADVWFHLDPDREPSAPVLVSEILYDVAGVEADEEWLELFNATGAPLDIGGWGVSDEEVADGSEGTVRLPMLVVPAGGTVVVALRASAFRALYGFDPDVEVFETAAGVPNGAADPTWSVGFEWTFNNSGDELLVIDPLGTIVDVATWEVPTGYPGVTPHPTNVVGGTPIQRTPVRQDTNAGAVDFSATLPASPGVAAGLCLDSAGMATLAGTACEDRNGCTTGVCTATGTCGTAVVCGDDGNACTIDVCIPATGTCGRDVAAGTTCPDASPADCDAASCDGAGACVQASAPAAAGHVCRATAGPCDVAESCDGTAAGACPVNAFATGMTCRSAAGVCDVAEMCDGSGAACPANVFAAGTVVCRVAAGTCDVEESCSGTSALCGMDVRVAAGTLCRGSAGACDVGEVCTGSSPACPSDMLRTSGAVCRPSSGVCDVAETCDGATAPCPANGLAAAGTVCRPTAGGCDVEESCNGTATGCPADIRMAGGTECRASAGPCDCAETCGGTAAACPPDGFLAGTECRAAAGPCDLAESCDGSDSACPSDELRAADEVCRAAAGDCDVAEECDGAGVSCPADGLAPDSTACTAAGACATGVCMGGACEPAPECMADGGPEVDAGTDAGVMEEDAGMEVDAAVEEDAGGGEPDAAVEEDAGGRVDAGRTGMGRDDDGCGCTVPGESKPQGAPLLLALALGALIVRRRVCRKGPGPWRHGEEPRIKPR